jgi:hypothetical protein
MRDYYDVIFSFWEIEKPPANIVVEKMEYLEEEIKSLQDRYDDLDHQACSHPIIVEGEDKELKEALKGKDNKDVLFKLHKEGFMYTHENLDDFYWGNKKLWDEEFLDDGERDRVLELIKECKSY